MKVISPKRLMQSVFPTVRNGSIFNASSLDLQFARTKTLDPRVTFTRASSGTYADSQGVIRTATTNLLLRSEEIGTSPWGTNNAGATTYTANAIAAPTGAVTADRVTATADFSGPNQFVSAISGLNYSLSFYVKAVTPGSLDSIRIECFSGRFAQFNITTRVFSGVNAAITPSSTSFGDGWVRVQCLFAAPSTGSLAVAVYASTSSDFYLWGAQLEQSSTVGEYIPTTSTINSAPRFDHNPTTGESLGLLVEEQRTNLLLRSEEFDQSPWTLFGTASRSANATTAPNGTLTADSVTLPVASGIYQSAATTAGITLTFSVYIRCATTQTVNILINTNLGDPTIKTVTATTAWQRFDVTKTTSAGTTAYSAQLDSGNGNTFFVWGAQLEAGSFPTSYIPTTTATVTRSADVASITGSNFSSWYRQDEGTVFAQSSRFALGSATGQYIVCEAGNSAFNNNELIQLGTQFGANNFQMLVNVGNVTQAALVEASTTSLAKYIGAYKSNDFAYTRDGSSPSVDVSGSVPSVSQLNIGSRPAFGNTGYLNGTIRRLTYWPQRLPNSTLQQITQ